LVFGLIYFFVEMIYRSQDSIRLYICGVSGIALSL
jgi:hypothetical protein